MGRNGVAQDDGDESTVDELTGAKVSDPLELDVSEWDDESGQGDPATKGGRK